jgi:hypothetical protein
MNVATGYSRRSTSRSPGSIVRFDRPAISVEYPWTYDFLLALKLIGCGSLRFKQVSQILREGKDPTFIVLGGSRIQKYCTDAEVDLPPPALFFVRRSQPNFENLASI